LYSNSSRRKANLYLFRSVFFSQQILFIRRELRGILVILLTIKERWEYNNRFLILCRCIVLLLVRAKKGRIVTSDRRCFREVERFREKYRTEK
jgi:hypothetical protein